MSSGTAVLIPAGKLFPREGKRRLGREVGGSGEPSVLYQCLSRDEDIGGSRWTVGIGRRPVGVDRHPPPPTEDDQCWSWWGGGPNPATPHPDPCPNCRVLTVVGGQGSLRGSGGDLSVSSGGNQCGPACPGGDNNESSDFVELVLVKECRSGGGRETLDDSSPPRTTQTGPNMSTEISYFQDVSVQPISFC